MIIKKDKQKIAYSDPYGYYRSHGSDISFLYESRSQNEIYGRQSLVVPNAALRITAKNEEFSLEALTETGSAILSCFTVEDFPYATGMQFNHGRITGRVERSIVKDLEVEDLVRQPNTINVLRTLLNKFSGIKDKHLGLYGAFAYDFARSFMNFGDRFADDEGPDFEFYLPTTVVYFDDIGGTAQVKRLYFDGKNDCIEERIQNYSLPPLPLQIKVDTSKDEYIENVEVLRKQIANGRFMQCVLSRRQGFSLQGHPLNSYAHLRKMNPSPYSFFSSLGDGRFLYGASPEMHIRVIDGIIEIRPIAGTLRKSTDIPDKEKAKQEFDRNLKERSEHSMLVDLAKSELSGLCTQGTVNIYNERDVEEYTHLFHYVTGIRGRLKPEFDALTALLATIPAGTLSGAPKLEAMKAITELENSRRQFYGGAVGYFSFDGDCNTGIIIRSAYVHKGMTYVRGGAGIVIGSQPEDEFKETRTKIRALLECLFLRGYR